MEEMIKVYNKNRFNVGIKKMNGMSELNIQPFSFARMSVEEIQWVNSISSVFRSGILTLDKENNYILEDAGVNIENNPNLVTEEEIMAALKKSASSIDKWMAGVTEKVTLARIGEIAAKMDLAKSKLDVLNKYIPMEDME